MLNRLQLWVNMLQDTAVCVDPHVKVNRWIGGDSREPFNRVAVQRVQKSNDVSIDLVLATQDLATGFSAALLKALLPERHSVSRYRSHHVARNIGKRRRARE